MNNMKKCALLLDLIPHYENFEGNLIYLVLPYPQKEIYNKQEELQLIKNKQSNDNEIDQKL